jgi:hypothetical protein
MLLKHFVAVGSSDIVYCYVSVYYLHFVKYDILCIWRKVLARWHKMRTIEGKVVVLGAQGNPKHALQDIRVIKSYTPVLAYKFDRKLNFRAKILENENKIVL